MSLIQGVFLESGIENGTGVTIRMTYDDETLPTVNQLIPPGLIGPGSQTKSAYQEDLNLSITVSIGDLTWTANIEDGNNADPFTFYVKEATLAVSEEVRANVSSEDGGLFTSFPFREDGGPAQISLEFNSSTNAFIDSGISASSFAPEFLTSCSGSIKTGRSGNQLAFNLNPATIEIKKLADEVTPPVAPLLNASTDSGNLVLTWQSDFTLRYRIEATSDLASPTWHEVETRFGTGAIITRTYPLTNAPRFYRVVASERPPAN